MTFARRVFLIAGAFGLLILLPMYFLESQIGRDRPPAITHPEYFYGFIGVAIAWQVAFLMIGRDPARFRPLMIPAMIEKATFAIAASGLFAQGRLAREIFAAGMIDLTLGILFAVAYLRTAPGPESSPGTRR